MQYEYHCDQCGDFEWTQKITDEPLTECPLCREQNKDSLPPKKLISLSAFQLKGGGWGNSGYSNK